MGLCQVDVRYQNLSKIGSGAYGMVCSATDTVTNKEVAIKKVADVFEDLVDAKRILREIKLLQHFAQHGRHENIVNLVDVMTGALATSVLWLNRSSQPYLSISPVHLRYGYS